MEPNETPEQKARKYADQRRAYYSEIITGDHGDQYEKYLYGAWKEIKNTWKVRTENYAPSIGYLTQPITPSFLAPAQRWMSADQDKEITYPVQTLKPKVQFEFVVEPKQLPRNVGVERRRRAYAAKNLAHILHELNVSPLKLIPVDIIAQFVGNKCKDLYERFNFLPLEIFDDNEYEDRNPEEWISMGLLDGIQHPIPAKAFLPIPKERLSELILEKAGIECLFQWTDVVVTNYNTQNKLYKVLTADGLQNIFVVPRIYLIFMAEDPEKFAKRVKSAVDLRDETEFLIKYQFYVDCLILEGTYDIEESSLEKILMLATRSKQIKITNVEFCEWLEYEIRTNHKRALCELEFRSHLHTYPKLLPLNILPKGISLAVPAYGKVETKMKNFEKIRDYFHWWTLYVIPESYRAIQLVVIECQKVQEMSLFTTNYGKFVLLKDFHSAQENQASQTMRYLKTSWLDNVTHSIRMSLRDVGKGWFDLNIKSWDSYKISKMKRLLELTKHHMQYALRVLVESSLKLFINILETPCQCCLDVPDDFIWGDNLVDTPFDPKIPPVFSIVLNMNKDGPFYGTDPDEFLNVFLQLLTTNLTQLHSMKQIEPFLLPSLNWADDLFLSSVGLLDPFVVEYRGMLERGYTKAVIPLKAYCAEYRKFIEFYNLDNVDYVTAFRDENHTAGEIKDEINRQIQLKEECQVGMPTHIKIGPFYVSVQALRTFLIDKRQDLIKRLLDMFAARMRKLMDQSYEEYKQIYDHLLEKPTCIEDIVELKEWMETIPVSVKNIEDPARRYVMEYEILNEFFYAIKDEDFQVKWEVIGWPYKIACQIDKTNGFLIEETDKFLKIQQDDETDLYDKIDTFTGSVITLSQEKDYSKLEVLAVTIARLWNGMKAAQERGILLNQRQKLFKVPVTPFKALTNLIKSFEPYKTLWLTADNWTKMYTIWMDNPLVNVDGATIADTVNEVIKTMSKLIRVFNDYPDQQAIAQMVKDECEKFKPYVPLIVALRNPGLKERHYEEITEKTGLKIKWSDSLTFHQCLKSGMLPHAATIISVSEAAAKEFSIEEQLNTMKEGWEDVNLEIIPFKNSGTFIMKITEEQLQLLDNEIVATQQISFSPFKKAFEKEIDDWENTLKLTSKVLDKWLEVQRDWMYLEPIFTSDDINRQLPTESKKYNTMERTWRKIMKAAEENPKVISFCPDQQLLNTLNDCSELLEIISKGLADYMETKRQAFPRFYFLSDDELLEILSQAKYPPAVQPHLKKCFEAVATIKFEEDMLMSGMISVDGETVPLNPTLYPRGQIENWMTELESTMQNTIKTIIESGLNELKANVKRNAWVLSWPGQVVIAGSQTIWTAGVTNALENDQLAEYVQYLLHYLDDLRSLIKTSLTPMQRSIVSALIVIEVHARDVTEELLSNGVKSPNDFEWIKQLRYYWIETDLKVRAVNAEFQYGYEYLGNTGRLVITPLTDRCYLTLTGALHLKLGGAPQGPAGTGKTETTKDLGKAMAIQTVVFNCSDQLDYLAMGKFFKGLASAGAWACFDEFNRIDIEVLSVIAQQVSTIQKAQKANLERFMFEGIDLCLRMSCAVFVTMNPGYAGRTELPDNLKALFRPVAMMVPDYTLIAEISLFSFGFSDARTLAGKITTTFKLSSEQLSAQEHYDFGMRAVKTVIAVAGNLKRERPKMDELQIILRALRDVNVPKFLKDDLVLFNGIVSDLFPRMIEQQINYGHLESSIKKVILSKGLECVPEYVVKVIQLFSTTVVRHGLMIVGPTGSGKTKCYEVLRDALTALKGVISPSGAPFERVHTYVLNPKSITMGQLYGEFDINTHEWTDGILPAIVRVGAAAEDSDGRWYILDGPVDAVWIENMNTVLDDNKKLCLTSGEIIKLTNYQKMIFEVADLAVASPATVSRCGMVYLEPAVLGLQPYLNCWSKTNPPLFEEHKENMLNLLQQYLLPAIKFLRTDLNEIVTSVDSAIVTSCLNLLDYRLRPLTGKDKTPPPEPQFLALMDDLLVPWVLFSIIWSVGATCDAASREKFDLWLREMQQENLKNKDISHRPAFPSTGLVYDYRLHDGGFHEDPMTEPHPPQWISWLVNIPEYVITKETKYSDIEIPILDNVRNSALLGMLAWNENNVLCVGPTGTGKTQTVTSKLSKNLHKKFLCDFIIFSACTTAKQVQEVLDSLLSKRRRGVYGPPIMKRQIFFIDDLNMPALEVFGAQPPIELIRQWMDFGGWYDLKNVGMFRQIVDTNFVAAMGPPGGGRNPVTLRLLRHFHYLAFTEIQAKSKLKIFQTILSSWLNRSTKELVTFMEPILTASLSVYDTVLTELLPTPVKIHYMFNLRDLSKVFQGMLMREAETLTDKHELIRLWYHENCRVYQDRMVNNEDREWFDQLLKTKIVEDFKMDIYETLENDTIIFGDFMDVESDERKYRQITNWEKVHKVVEDYLDDYNSQTTKTMKLVLFMDAIAHLSRISRIIRQPLGNALLLGMGGSGRQSMTRLAAFIGEFICFQIELSKTYGIKEWRDDLKKCMINAGLMDKPTVFLFSDTQIKSEMFLEDINNILNSGDVPNIYKPEELDKIYNGMKIMCQEMEMTPTKTNLFSLYQKSVKSNMHTVLPMSPIGDVFRARLRQFPALINCCTIDWFSEWPDSALQSVALQFLEEIPDLGVSDEILNGIVVAVQYMHQSVIEASNLFLQELNRHNYVTPTSYLELLRSYVILMDKKKSELKTGIKRLQTGMDKLINTREEVEEMQVQLKIMKPRLEEAARDAEIMIRQIEKETVEVEKTKAIVEKQEQETQVISDAATEIAASAQKDLDQAMPALLAAEASLKALNKNDVSEVKVMKHPPPGVIKVMEAICIINDIKPLRIPGPKLGQKVDDYWPPAQLFLSDPGAFLSTLMNFDKSRLTAEKINKLKSYVKDPDFSPAKIIKVSKACTSLCMWVHAMFKYYYVDLAVAPKKAALAEANAKLDAITANLNKTKAELKAIMDGLEELNVKLQEKIKYKEEQEANVQLCLDRMARAVRLVNGLADEKVRWTQTIASLEIGIHNVTGDILISSGALAYITPFTSKYRQDLLTKWIQVVQENNIPHSENCTPVDILGDPVYIRLWQVDGLPRDSLSTENAVLVFHSNRWPLFIDPQAQANKWIRNMGKPLGINIVKLSDRSLIRTFETAIRFGKPVLLENVGTELDPALDPILTKQIFKQAGCDVIRLGDVTIPYSEDFRLYITTKLANPHYTPELSIKVLLVNFALVSSGLQDQLLAMVVANERADLEETRSALVINNAKMKHELKEIEDRILIKLSTSAQPVDDIDFIVTLEASKIKSDDIKAKVAAAEKTQQDIEETRKLYVPVSNRGQLLFFCCADLANIDSMYQYSLDWFKTLFVAAMEKTEKSEDINERINTINEYFTFSLYTNVCRSLFERNKLHFAFLLCARILMDEKKIDPAEWRYLLAGGTVATSKPNPKPSWLEPRAWSELLALETLPRFKEFVQEIDSLLPFFFTLFNSPSPTTETYPSPWDEILDDFQKMCLLKCIRPENVTNAMQDFISKNIGKQFIEPQTTDLSAMYADSTALVPLIFILSPGTDPAVELNKFAEKMKMAKRLMSISLGQGQGPRAEKMLEIGQANGGWVFLQNCHLAPSWMSTLEHLLENLNGETVHKDLRIWLTSTPTPQFPVAILQNSSKMTMEPPRGVKANLLKAYLSPVQEYVDFINSNDEHVPTFKLFLFSLCLFHGITLERRKFGPLGFNIPYEFTDGDLNICISQLHMFLREYSEIPFKVLKYTAGEINYGGRVTDDWDRRCLTTILNSFYRPECLDPNHVFDKSGAYHQLPPESTIDDYVKYIKTLPINDDPDLFGLHANADISCARTNTYLCLSTLLALQPKEAASREEESPEAAMERIATSILDRLPEIMDHALVMERYPVTYQESLNTVLGQEVVRYNRLLLVIKESLKNLLLALKGQIVMSDALENLSMALYTNRIPDLWQAKAYPSLQPLGSWVLDLEKRVAFMQNWIDNGIPPAFWISGFFFPQAFLTGSLQNYARKYVLSIDTINYAFKVLDEIPIERKPDGCCIYGLFLEGARFNRKINALDESKPKELYTEMPCMWFIPEVNHMAPQAIYECPVYKTLLRKGTLSTTGHSTNYVLTIEVPSRKPQSHWIKRGVALFCALDY